MEKQIFNLKFHTSFFFLSLHASDTSFLRYNKTKGSSFNQHDIKNFQVNATKFEIRARKWHVYEWKGSDWHNLSVHRQCFVLSDMQRVQKTMRLFSPTQRMGNWNLWTFRMGEVFLKMSFDWFEKLVKIKDKILEKIFSWEFLKRKIFFKKVSWHVMFFLNL